MSKRNLIIIVLGGVALFAATLAVFAWVRGGFGDPVFTDVIPAKRPIRLDHRQLEAFSGKSIDEIIEMLMTTASENEAPITSTEAPAPALLGMLPDAPLPFPKDAIPRDEEGLKKFVTGMQQEKEGEPSPADQWQFNLALAALKVDPAKIPEAIRLDTHPVPESETFPVRLVPRENALFGPLAFGHFLGDDGLGIVAGGGSALFSIIAEGGLKPHGGLSTVAPGNGVYPADFDGDGDLDLFITRAKGLPNSLLRNEGEGKFEDVTIALGLLSFNDTTSAAWLDYDGDGFLDLLVGSIDHPLELYHQTSGGTFQPIAWDLGLWVPRGVHTIAVSDFSGDGSPDFFLGISGSADRLCLAKPSPTWEAWRFENVATASAVDSGSSASGFFFDFDSDGKPDLFLIPAATTPPRGLRLLHNEGEGRFADVTTEAGLEGLTGITAGGVADLDNDSYEDLILGTAPLAINRVFWNREGAGFKEVTIVSEGGYLDEPVAFTSADLEGNGTIDILSRDRSGTIRWLEASGAMDRWITVKVLNAPAGFRIALSVRDKDWVLHEIERRPGGDATIMIGIGEADVIERITVLGPEGGEALHTVEKVALDQELVVTLPKQPRKRAVVPIKEPTGAATAPSSEPR
jgi:hypothetical protein